MVVHRFFFSCVSERLIADECGAVAAGVVDQGVIFVIVKRQVIALESVHRKIECGDGKDDQFNKAEGEKKQGWILVPLIIIRVFRGLDEPVKPILIAGIVFLVAYGVIRQSNVFQNLFPVSPVFCQW